jgi:hypothetical protein
MTKEVFMRLYKIVISILAIFAVCVLAADYAAASVGGPVSALKAGPTERSQNLGKIERAVMSEKISARLESLGYDPKEAVDKIALLSDREVADAAENLETVRAGGDYFFGGYMLFDLLLLVALILFILWLLDNVRIRR